MSHMLWSQDIFTKGEISPLMYARVSVAPYYNGLKVASNVITFPQGAAGKRFGTIYQNTIMNVDNAQNIFFEAFQYLAECVYLVVMVPQFVYIYLEGILVATITTSDVAGVPYGNNLLRSVNHTVLDNLFRTATGIYPPMDISRRADPTVRIIAFDTVNNILTLNTTPYSAGFILPVRFTTTGTLFKTNPQILGLKTYFFRFITATTVQIYANPVDAKAQINAFQILSAGTGTQSATTLNTWTMAATKFVNVPVFDFTGGVPYKTTYFTPGPMVNSTVAIQITTLGTGGYLFTPENEGGTFVGGGGIGRIIQYINPLLVAVYVLQPFVTNVAIPGTEAIVTVPAWSAIRGWPRICSSFQNRAFFANSDLLPNGLWGSVSNDYNNFDDAETDADNAISWYPTSDDINFIRFIVPYRSLTIHTNSGVFSTPLSVETAITPQNFSLTIQDSTPADKVLPRGIDNQIVIISGNDAHSLLWDGFNNAYQSNIISVANEHLIRNPTDEAAFVDLTRAGSRYMLIINEDGSLAIYQTLISEDVQGFTPAFLDQSYGKAFFRWVTTNFDGRGWFVTERQIATPGAQIPISTFTQFTIGNGTPFALLNAQGFNLLNAQVFDLLQNDFITEEPVFAFQFENVGTLPTSMPQVMINTWYWGVPTDSGDIRVYLSIEDALSDNNPIQFSDAGTGVLIVPWLLQTNFFIEELSFAAKVDCANLYKGLPQSTFNNLPQFNAQNLKIQGDGFGFDYVGLDSTVKTIAHGNEVPVALAQMGFPINVEIEPLPLSTFLGSTKSSSLMTPTHIRDVILMMSDTIGGFVNGVPIALQNFDEVPIGTPPVPVNGFFEYGIMAGWDDFKSIGLTITHNDPFDFKLIGLFYKVDN